ncbi:DUF4870 domain-containing protein, partial [Candidatus Woesearchaeota archaeon]|nr:DUF4870 domain-containing protein [Candidatus Woesearchaeota archaeon]
DGKVFAIISYLSILWIVGLLVQKDNKFTMYHVKQGIVLTIVEVVLWLAVSILSYALFFAGFLSQLVAGIVWLIMIVFIIMGIVAAANGEKKELPYIGQYAKSLKF